MFEWLDWLVPRQFQFQLEVIGDLAVADTIINTFTGTVTV
jgi:hypothetical protein